MVHIAEHQVSNTDSQTILFMSGSRTVKSTAIKSISNTINSNNVDQLGTTGTANFFVCGFTCHSKLYFPVNKSYFDLSGIHLYNLQNNFLGINVVIIDEVSMMGGNYLDD